MPPNPEENIFPTKILYDITLNKGKHGLQTRGCLKFQCFTSMSLSQDTSRQSGKKVWRKPKKGAPEIQATGEPAQQRPSSTQAEVQEMECES